MRPGARHIVMVVTGALSFPVFALAQERGDLSVLDDPVVRAEAGRGIEYLYDMEFEEARQAFLLIDRRYPDHPIGPFLLALNTWWKILPDLSNEAHDEAFHAAMAEVIARSDRMLDKDEDDFDAAFFKGAALGFRGRLRSNRGKWLQAARDGMRAMNHVLGIAERRPDVADYAFGQGIYHYYAAAAPAKYPFLKPLMIFFPDGDREQGIRELERTMNHGQFIRTEAAYFLLQIYYLFENDFDKSVEYVTWLRARHPRNAFFHVIEGRVYARWGRWRMARPVFEEVGVRFESGQTGYGPALAEQAFYFVGQSHVALGSYEAALPALHKLKALGARDDRHTYFEVAGRLLEGMAHDARGRRSRAVALYREVLGMKDRAGAHERAKRYLDAPYEG